MMRNTYSTDANGERKTTSTVSLKIVMLATRGPCDRKDCAASGRTRSLGKGQVSLKRADCPNLDTTNTRGIGGRWVDHTRIQKARAKDRAKKLTDT